MSKELIDWLKSYIPSGDGHNSQYANDLADAVELLEAADALEAKAAPVAYITGQFAGRCIIEPINRAAVLPTGMALYSHPQPSAVPDGWKLVPVEPTTEMLSEFKRAYKDGDFWRERIHGAVCAMLAAAPSAPKADDPVKVQLLEALESAADALARAEFFEQADNARAAISAVREEVMK